MVEWISANVLQTARVHSKAFVTNSDPVNPVRRTLWKFCWFIALVICCLFVKRSGDFLSLKSINNRLRSGTGKHDRLIGHVVGTRDTSRGRLLIKKYGKTEKHSNKCVFVQISMLDQVKNSHYSSCSDINLKHNLTPRQRFRIFEVW